MGKPEKGDEQRNLNLNVTLHPDPAVWDLLTRIYNQGRHIMADVNSMRKELVEANEATNELAADVQELIGKIKVGAMSEEEAAEIQAGLSDLKNKLQGVASQYPVPVVVPDVPPVEEPPVEPPVVDPTARRNRF